MQWSTVRLVIVTAVAVSVVGVHGCGPTEPEQHDETLVNPEARLLVPEAVQQIVEITEDAIVFPSTAPGISELEASHIIVSGEGHGLLRKVLSVTQDGDEITLHTEQAALTDLFERATIHVTQALDPDDFEPVEALGAPSNPGRAPRDFFDWSFDQVLYQDGVSEVRVRGAFTVSDPSFTIDLEIDDWEVQYLFLTATLDETAAVELLAEFHPEELEREYEIIRLTGKKITVVVGGWPVVVTPVVTLFVGIEGSIWGLARTVVTQDASLTAGVQYDDGDWDLLSDFSCAVDYTPPVARVTCEVRASAGVKIEAVFYELFDHSVLSAYVKPSVYGELEAELAPGGNDWELYGGLEVAVGGGSDLIAWEFEFPVIDYRVLLADSDGGGIGEWMLGQNIPDPFCHSGGSTAVPLRLDQESHVLLEFWDEDMTGTVRTVVDNICDEGYQIFTWDGRDESGSHVPSGEYPYVVIASDSQTGAELFSDTRVAHVQCR